MRLFKNESYALGDEILHLYKQVLSLFVEDFSFLSELPLVLPVQKALVALIHEANREKLVGLVEVGPRSAWLKGQTIGRASWLNVVYFGDDINHLGFTENDYVRNLQLRLLLSPFPEEWRDNLCCNCAGGTHPVRVKDKVQSYHFLNCSLMAGPTQNRHNGIVRLLSKAINDSCVGKATEVEVIPYWDEVERCSCTPDLGVLIGGVKHIVDVTVRSNGAPTYGRLDTAQLLRKAEDDKMRTYKNIRFDGTYHTFGVDMFGNLSPQAEIFLGLLARCSDNDKVFIANFRRSLSVWLAKAISSSLFTYLADCVPSSRT